MAVPKHDTCLTSPLLLLPVLRQPVYVFSIISHHHCCILFYFIHHNRSILMRKTKSSQQRKPDTSLFSQYIRRLSLFLHQVGVHNAPLSPLHRNPNPPARL